MQMNNTHQQEQTGNDLFVLSLSISTETANSKKQAESIIKFKLQENIPVKIETLTPILTKYLHSTQQLRDYCTQDTLALVRIFQFLCDKLENNGFSIERLFTQ